MDEYRNSDSDSERSPSLIEKIGRGIGFAIGIPLALLVAVSILGEEVRWLSDFGKLVSGNSMDCSAVRDYLDVAAADYEALNSQSITSIYDYQTVTDQAVRHLLGVTPPEDAKDFHNENLKWWLYMRDDFVDDVQRTLDDEEAANRLSQQVSEPVNDELSKLIRECPQETREFERVLKNIGSTRSAQGAANNIVGGKEVVT